ncbi:hypothetical protein [Salinispira pacifica]|uniref:DUF304 domain-containing protein n=1 Tax=Salinispira pacifica TaxID=1307761 RepID=V5WMH3_9SPIO|nr:hypothetical protein [Salinispira pacifica]AHC16361.1 hypothetical protein L21SP2_3017 [Salinispira pacifica]
MTIQNPRTLRAAGASLGPLVIALGPMFQDGREIWYGFVLLIITLFVFLIFQRIQPKYLFRSTDQGIIVTGGKTGLYDPDYVPYSDINDVEYNSGLIIIKRKLHPPIELRIPGKHRQAVVDEIRSGISGTGE